LVRAACRVGVAHEGNVYANRMRRLVNAFPEVETVITPARQARRRTEPDGFLDVEFLVPLKPADQWRKGPQQRAADRRDEATPLRKGFPAPTFGFRSTSRTKCRSGVPGIDAENAIKNHRSRFDALRKIAVEIRGVMEKVRASPTFQGPPLLGQPTIKIASTSARGALRPVAGRHQRHQSRRPSAPGGGRPQRGGQRPPLPLVVRLAPRYRRKWRRSGHPP